MKLVSGWSISAKMCAAPVPISAGYSLVFFWAAGVAILIVPIALALITIDRGKFTGTQGDAPVVHLV